MSLNKTQIIGITGSSGFVGKALTKYFYELNFKVIPLKQSEFQEFKMYDDKAHISGYADLLKKFNIDILIHCAAVIDQSLPETKFISVNSTLTKNIFLSSKNAKIKRFIFLSTIKCQNEKHTNDMYSESKRSAEKQLINEYSKLESSVKLSILRLPAILGKTSGGNLDKVSKVLNLNLPIILSKVAQNNKKSFLTIEGLKLTILEIINNRVSNSYLSVYEGEDISTYQLIMSLKEMENSKSKILITNHFIFSFLKIFLPRVYDSLFENLYFKTDNLFSRFKAK